MSYLDPLPADEENPTGSGEGFTEEGGTWTFEKDGEIEISAIGSNPLSITSARDINIVSEASDAAIGIIAGGDLIFEDNVGQLTLDQIRQFGTTVPRLIGLTSARRTAGNVTTNSVTFTAFDTATDLTVSGVEVGDVLELGVNYRWNDEAEVGYADAATRVAGANVNFVSGTTLGVGGWIGDISKRSECGGSLMYTLVSGDISSGSVTVRFHFRSNGGANKTIIASTANQPFTWYAKVWRLA